MTSRYCSQRRMMSQISKVKSMSIITTTKTTLSAVFFSALLLLPNTAQASDNAALLQQLADSEQSSAAHRARNKYRNPTETLQFFGLTPQMSVLEIWPGHGWYTEILAPFLKDEGKLTLAQFRHNDGSLKNDRSIFWARVSERLSQRLAQNADYFGRPQLIELDPPQFYPLKVEQFDMALTLRNAHIWNEEGHLFATLQSIFQALKPGGILGMVEHRAGRLSDISS